jgi:hypothetical protein
MSLAAFGRSLGASRGECDRISLRENEPFLTLVYQIAAARSISFASTSQLRSTPFLPPSYLARQLHASSTTRDNHFDTHQFVDRMIQQGLKREQAEGVMAALAEVVDESITGMSRTMVTKAEQEKVRTISLAP